MVKVLPGWVVLFDELELPLAVPLFDLFFSGDGMPGITMGFVVDQAMHAVLLGEAGHEVVAMLIDAAKEVAGHAGIEGAIAPAGHDVYEVLFHKALDSRLRGNDNVWAFCGLRVTSKSFFDDFDFFFG